jgi:peptidyl-prolyl cis-trans isomerase SurA
MKRARTISILFLSLFGFGAPVRAEFDNGIKAVVHDSVITYGEVQSDALVVIPELRRQYGRQPDVLEKKFNEALNDSLEKSLEQQLILQDFKSAGYNLPESIIDEVVQAEIKQRFGDRAKLTQTLQAQGITYERWRQQARDRFIVRQLQNKNVFQQSIISPFKIETYYREHTNDFRLEAQVKLRMIVLNKPAEAEVESTRALAREILSKLKEGAAFSEMASIQSQGSQRSRGGDWGWVERSVLRKELAEVAFQMKPGELSDLVETSEAIFLMLVEDLRAPHVKPLAEVREEIEATLSKLERERAQKLYIDKLKKKTFVRYF